jgi:hypothetical protein
MSRVYKWQELGELRPPKFYSNGRNDIFEMSRSRLSMLRHPNIPIDKASLMGAMGHVAQ